MACYLSFRLQFKLCILLFTLIHINLIVIIKIVDYDDDDDDDVDDDIDNVEKQKGYFE